MMKRTRSVPQYFGLCAVALLLVSARASAQSTATLQGTITDAQNAVMPGVTVTIQNTATSIERTTVTDAAGQYVAAALQPGHYMVTAHLEGFQDAKSETDIGPAQTIAMNLKLNVGTLAENVTVTGASPLIDTATASVRRCPAAARRRRTRVSARRCAGKARSRSCRPGTVRPRSTSC